MHDIFYLFIVPVMLSIIIAIVVVLIINKFSKRNSMSNRISNISSQPRSIQDWNHKHSKIERLLVPNHDTAFINDYRSFLERSICETNVLD